MRKSSVKATEHKCPECNGTGFPMVMQPVKPSRKIYPVQCENCGGKGRIVGTADCGLTAFAQDEGSLFARANLRLAP